LPNKQFNSDSQRLALSLRVEFSVYGAVFKSGVCAAHTLIGRYNHNEEHHVRQTSVQVASAI